MVAGVQMITAEARRERATEPERADEAGSHERAWRGVRGATPLGS